MGLAALALGATAATAATVGAGVVGAGAMLYNGHQASSAAKDASSAQTAANQAAIGEQQREFDTNQENLRPWLEAGQTALGQQQALLGIGGPADYAGYVQNNPDLLAAYQANSGGQSMADWGKAHWSQFGSNEARAATPFTGGQQKAIDQLKASPLYKSLYRNGSDAILANGSATGGLRGGNIEGSLANFGADTLSSVIQQQLSNLGGISGNGMTTGGNLGTLGQTSANNISSLMAQNGQAQAGGILSSAGFTGAGFTGAANALSKTVGQLYGTWPSGSGMSYTSGSALSPMSNTLYNTDLTAPGGPSYTAASAPSFAGLTPTPSPTLF